MTFPSYPDDLETPPLVHCRRTHGSRATQRTKLTASAMRAGRPGHGPGTPYGRRRCGWPPSYARRYRSRRGLDSGGIQILHLFIVIRSVNRQAGTTTYSLLS